MVALEIAVGFAVLLALVVVAFLVLATYNDVVGLRQRIDRAWANVDVVLKQRHDQLPALVDAVRGVMAFERDVLETVARERAAYSPTAPIPVQAATSVATSAAVRSLLAVVERYPELKSASNVLSLQAEIERLEGMLADRRELYNDQVYRYDTRIAQFPAVLLAALLDWHRREFFAAAEDERTRPEASLEAQ
jgi:LemA protein